MDRLLTLSGIQQTFCFGSWYVVVLEKQTKTQHSKKLTAHSCSLTMLPETRPQQLKNTSMNSQHSNPICKSTLISPRNMQYSSPPERSTVSCLDQMRDPRQVGHDCPCPCRCWRHQYVVPLLHVVAGAAETKFVLHHSPPPPQHLSPSSFAGLLSVAALRCAAAGCKSTPIPCCCARCTVAHRRPKPLAIWSKSGRDLLLVCLALLSRAGAPAALQALPLIPVVHLQPAASMVGGRHHSLHVAEQIGHQAETGYQVEKSRERQCFPSVRAVP